MRYLARSVLRGIDALYQRWHGLQSVGEVLYEGHTRYRVLAREFPDGTWLAPGNFIGVLHFNNARFPSIEASTATRAALHFARLMLESMRILAEQSRQAARFSDLVVYRAITWLPPHGCRIGFLTEPLLEGPCKCLMAAYFRLLVWAFAPAAQTRALARPAPRRYTELPARSCCGTSGRGTMRGNRATATQPSAQTLPRVPGRVYLSFDDGPDLRWTTRILDLLAQTKARATFFVVGRYARASCVAAPERGARACARVSQLESSPSLDDA